MSGECVGWRFVQPDCFIAQWLSTCVRATASAAPCSAAAAAACRAACAAACAAPPPAAACAAACAAPPPAAACAAPPPPPRAHRDRSCGTPPSRPPARGPARSERTPRRAPPPARARRRRARWAPRSAPRARAVASIVHIPCASVSILTSLLSNELVAVERPLGLVVLTLTTSVTSPSAALLSSACCRSTQPCPTRSRWSGTPARPARCAAAHASSSAPATVDLTSRLGDSDHVLPILSQLFGDRDYSGIWGQSSIWAYDDGDDVTG